MSAFYSQDPKQNTALHQQQQDRLSQVDQASAAMRELTLKDRQHRLHALLWRLTAWRSRRRGEPTGSRSWDH